MPRILLTGKDGQVGWELQRSLATLGQLFPVGRDQLDLTNPDSIRRTIREVQPDLIVNAAAYTAVDKAESEPELALKINGVAPGILAEQAKAIGAALVHYSTDYVFDGARTSPYSEEGETNPVNVYGKTKLAGDVAIESFDIPHLIFRTSWVYGPRGRNFMLTILRLAREKKELTVVNDQIGAPTSSRNIAEATAQVLAQVYSPLVSKRSKSSSLHFFDKVSGVYNLTAAGEVSWFGFAQAILDCRMDKENSTSPRLQLIPTNSTNYPSPARRPANSLLLPGKMERTFGVVIPCWRPSLEQVLSELG